MSTRRKTTTIGLFVIIAVAMLLGGIVIFGSGRLFRPTLKYKAYFDSRLKGLSIGSPVMFRGVRIGSVSDITIDVDREDDELSVPVIFEIEPDRFSNLRSAGRSVVFARATINRLVDKGLRAHLEIDSIVTGQMVIELDFDTDSEAHYVEPVGRSDPPEFPTVRSTVEELTASLREIPVSEIMQTLKRVIDGLDKRVNDKSVDETIDAAKKTLNDISALATSLNSEIAPQLHAALEEIRLLGEHLRTKTAAKLDDALGEAGELMDNVNDQLPETAGKLNKALDDFSSLSDEASQALVAVRAAAGDDSDLILRLDTALRELAEAARAINQTADYLQRHPESLLRGKPMP